MSSPPPTEPAQGNPSQLTFARLPRPQKVLDLNRPLVPTKSLLMQFQAHAKSPEKLPQGTPLSTIPPPLPPPPPRDLQPTSSHVPHALPDSMITLGKFAQDSTEWFVRARRGHSGLVMAKKLSRTTGLHEENVLKNLTHTNIARMIHAFCEGDKVLLGLEYCRYTLGEILHVHLKLEVQQVQHIACSVSGGCCAIFFVTLMLNRFLTLSNILLAKS